MFRTTSHRQVALAVALVVLAVTSAVGGVAVAQTDASSDETTESERVTNAALTATNETAEDDVSATIVADGDRLFLHSADNQTVRLQTNASAGTQLTVTLRSAEYNFLTSAQVTVSEDGSGTATFDLSDVAPGATFTATASADDGAEVEGIVVNASATVHRDAAFVPADADSNVTIRGRVMDSAATKLDVRVASESEGKTESRTVTVGENRTFAAGFDLSSVADDTEVSVEVGGIPRSANAVVVTTQTRAPTVYVFVETPPNATIRYPQETVLVHPAADQTIYGTTNLRPGTELTVEAVRDEPNSPGDFTRTANVTVGENGEFSADLNFSGVEPGTEFSVRVGDGLAMRDGRVVNESVTLPSVETTTGTESTSGPGVPGFGVSTALVALAALVAGFALARRT